MGAPFTVRLMLIAMKFVSLWGETGPFCFCLQPAFVGPIRVLRFL
jgi:hypothetical protein